MSDATVLVVGAGPVGLVLALELGRRGVDTVIIERNPAPLGLPKMDRCNPRTMEHFRRVGLADRIRARSFPSDAAMDIVILTTLAAEPLVRLRYPSVDEARRAIAASRDGTQPLEPSQIVSQYTLEPFLRSVVEELPNVTVMYGCELVSFEAGHDGVSARTQTASGEVRTFCADYLVGCDGGRSTVRKQLGIELLGTGSLARKNQIFLRCDNFFDVSPIEPARMYFFANSDESFLVTQDDRRHFSFHTNCFGDEAELRKTIDEAIGLPIEYEILAATPWTLHLLAAERYGEGPVFLAGDSAHLVTPAGALGLNTGIGDVVDLSWKLAGVLEGWGGPGLLASYEAERRPVGLRSVEASRYATQGSFAWRAVVRPSIAEDTTEGRGTRRAVACVASTEQRKVHEMVGTEMGYRYEESPLICHEPGEWPPDVREVYIPTARPGARLPHMWLTSGEAIQDRIGEGYTLLEVGEPDGDPGMLVEALTQLGAPCERLRLLEAALHEVYQRNLLLLRPDMHVAWRGDEPPDQPGAVARRVTGH